MSSDKSRSEGVAAYGFGYRQPEGSLQLISRALRISIAMQCDTVTTLHPVSSIMASDRSLIYVLITGVSRGGLGDALTTELLKRRNIHVLASGLADAHLSHLPESDRISRLQLDVTSPSSIAAAVAATKDVTEGRLHYLINNAGYGYMMPLLDAEAQAVKQNFEVNVFGLMAVTQAFFPLLKEGEGTVVNQCSIASLQGGRQPYIGTYCATKAAVASLNDTMRLEFAPFGVKVCYNVTLARA